MTKRILVFAAALMGVAMLNLNAQEADFSTLPFTRIDRNPRTSALAGAGVASTSADAYGAFSNAAKLAFMMETMDVAAGMQLWEMSNEVDKTTNLQGAVAYSGAGFSVALGGAFQKGVPMGNFTPKDYLFGLGVSYAATEWLGVGLNARYAAQNLAPNAKLNGFSVDLSVLGQVTPELSVAAALGCIGPRVQGSTASYNQSSYFRAGVAWKQPFAEVHSVELMLDGEFDFAGAVSATVGAEYTYNEMVFVRAGYRAAAEKALIPSHLGVGAGLQFFGVRVEASYLTASPVLGNTLNLGVGYRF